MFVRVCQVVAVIVYRFCDRLLHATGTPQFAEEEAFAFYFVCHVYPPLPASTLPSRSILFCIFAPSPLTCAIP